MFNSTEALANLRAAVSPKPKHTEPLSLLKGEEFSKIASIFSCLKIHLGRLSNQNCQQTAVAAY